MEPMWAFELLENGVRLPAAAKITRDAEIAEARWAGKVTALFTFFVLLGVIARTWPHEGGGTDDVIRISGISAVFCIGVLLWIIALERSARAVVDNANQFYNHVETLLEL